MPKLVTLSTDNVCTAENQQETSKVDNFYISGFCAREMSCSVIKQSRPYGSGFSYSPDLTVSNEDLILLRKVNASLCDGRGVISAIHVDITWVCVERKGCFSTLILNTISNHCRRYCKRKNNIA